ncbi:putative membrane protein [Fontibacillus phaseoli]|uniref:Putative membrane protein n=2 Tax=Fontibacillus phaseoli TaxID=1416533 RepID=A0A369BA87_9BACL|nr:putative membrane protein [Fontibacillus phaseoli]
MKGTTIDPLLEQPIGLMAGYFSVAVVELIVFLSCFELVTRYRCWHEIKRGNLAASLATGGKIFGLCNILRFATARSTIYEFMAWSFVGAFLLFLAYIMFEFVTPVFRIDKEIAEGNVAVGFIAMAVSVSVSYVIGACIA